MSYSSYYSALRDIETQGIIRKSQIQASILAQDRLRRSRIENETMINQINSDVFRNHSLTQAQRLREIALNQSILRRSRIQGDIETNRLQRQAALRRSRLQVEIRSDKVNRQIEKSRLEAQIQASRLNSNRNLEDSLRRSKVQANVNYYLNRY